MEKYTQSLIEINSKNLVNYLSEYCSDLFENISEVSFTEAKAGMVNSVYRLETTKGNYYLKQFLERPKDVRFAQFKLSQKERMKATEIAQRQFKADCTFGMICETKFLDHKNYIIIDEEIPNSSPILEALSAGDLNLYILPQIARNLANVHKKYFGIEDFVGNRDFAEKKIKNKILPNLENVNLSPAARSKIQAVAESYLQQPTTLIHGDFCSTNILLSSSDVDLQLPHFIDFEGAHFGNPSFDLAFFLSELIYFNLHSTTVKYDLEKFLHTYFEVFNYTPARTELTIFTGCMLSYLLGKGNNLIQYAVSETNISEAQMKADQMLNNSDEEIFNFIK